MVFNGWRVHTRWDPAYQAHDVYLIKVEPDGSEAVVTDFTMKSIPRHGIAERIEPIKDGDGLLQAIMDAAWEAGMRPRGFKDHTNELTAVRYHLEDMRKLAKVDRP